MENGHSNGSSHPNTGSSNEQVLLTLYFRFTDDRVAFEHCDGGSLPRSVALASQESDADNQIRGQISIRSDQLAEQEQHISRSLALIGSQSGCADQYSAALKLLARGIVRHAIGDLDGASSALNEVQQICAKLEETPVLEDDRRANVVAREARLTPREVEVLQCVSEGLTDAQVAEELYISPRTVSQHLSSIFNKIGVRSRGLAIRWAVEHGLV